MSIRLGDVVIYKDETFVVMDLKFPGELRITHVVSKSYMIMKVTEVEQSLGCFSDLSKAIWVEGELEKLEGATPYKISRIELYKAERN